MLSAEIVTQAADVVKVLFIVMVLRVYHYTVEKCKDGDAGRNISPINPAIGLSLPLLAALQSHCNDALIFR